MKYSSIRTATFVNATASLVASTFKSVKRSTTLRYIRECIPRAGVLIALALACAAPQQGSAITGSDIATSINAYNNTFMVRSGGKTYYKRAINNSAENTNWTAALCIQGMEDAYERTGDPTHRAIVSDLCTTFLQDNPTPWDWDGWNDDIAWMSLALIRGYQMTGNTSFLTAARYGFDLVWARGWDTVYNGGGIWEQQPEKTPAGEPINKNALSNNPNGKLACLIYQSTLDTWYLDRAKQIYDWSRSRLFNASNGQVYTSIDRSDAVDTGKAVYNQGSFVDFANYLHQITGEARYYNDAILAINYTKNSLTSNGIISNSAGYLDTWADEFARGLGHFVGNNRLWDTYHAWMVQNADAAWSHRRTDLNITWNGWTSQTPIDDTLRATKFVSAVAWLQFTPPTKPTIGGSYVIVSKQNGIAIDNASSTANGAGMILWGLNNGRAQVWNITPNVDGSWNIVSQRSWKSLDVPNSSTANGTQIIQWTWHRGSNQRWWIDQQSDGSYRIRNKATSGCLDNSSSTTNGTPLIQWSWNGGLQQRWILQ
jgi:predicted alpha-1,6-mannanase (GH76 family)